MTADPFPEIWSNLEISDLPSHRWIECANCIDNKSLDDGNTDPQEWAARHALLYPAHNRYRIVSQVGFSVKRANAPEPAAP